MFQYIQGYCTPNTVLKNIYIYSPLVLVTSGESSSWSYVSFHPCACPSIWTHISVTTGRNLLMLGMMMGYDLGMMPVVSQLCLIWCTDKNVWIWKRFPPYKATQHRIQLVLFSPRFAHYIGLVLAAHFG